VDIFKFENPKYGTKMEQGRIVTGLKSKTWIERYRESGEFTLVAYPDSDIRSQLPIGSFISHTDTTEVMIVENHEINDDKDKDSEITITGRGFETFLENRIVGANKDYSNYAAVSIYSLTSDYTWNHAVKLIGDHILEASLLDDNSALAYVSVIHDIVDAGGSDYRSIKIGDVYTSLLELLAVDDLGIKVIRPGVLSPLGIESSDLVLLIHKGVDRSGSLVYSYEGGEIESADYLWSNKKLKNTAIVSGRWIEVMVTTGGLNYERRMMYVDASDVDQGYEAIPSGGDLTLVKFYMQQRGYQALSSQKEIALSKTEVSKEGTKLRYRIDYDVGDRIMVSGDYNEGAIQRVAEYVEIEDETGVQGYPTLTAVG